MNPHPDRGSTPVVPLHPEPVADDARTVRWVMPAGTLDFAGAVVSVPASLQALLDDGTVEAVDVEPTSITVRLRAHHEWRTHGARVRTALHAALADPAHWQPASRGSIDERLRMAVRDVIDGDVGAYIRSHGGHIELVDARDGHVRVRLGGACTHCPVSDVTLSARFETALRLRCPDLIAVTTAPEPAGHRRILGFPRRRAPSP